MKTPFLLLIAAVLWCAPAFADDFPYGQFKVEEMQMKAYDKDKTAHAIVLNEYGKTWISSQDGLPLIHEYHVKIKIFDSKAFDKGDVEILLRKNDNNSFEKIRDIEAITFYTNAQGGIQRSELDPKKIITEKKSQYRDAVKFAMPNVTDGCVIEYKYTIESPYTLSFRDWIFQSDIPKIYSEYEARIPAYFDFKASLRGFYKLTKHEGTIDQNCFEVRGNRCDCSKMVYGMADLPAFKEEEYMTAAKNFVSAINYELNQYVDPYDGTKHVKTQTWDDVDRTLKQHEDFGSQLRKTGLFKEQVKTVTAGLTDDLSKAKAIYAYIKKTLKQNNYIGIFAENGLRKTLDTHTGNVADINMCLIVALNAAGINTDAVLLSTREHGLINMLYPVVGDFNYIIAKANIGNKSYLLDATDPILPFGMLPVDCINGKGRVMVADWNKPSYWMDMEASHRRTLTNMMDLTLQPNGKLTGTIRNYLYGYEALDKRRAIKKFNTIDEYVENLDEKLAKLKIKKFEITNVDSLDLPISETFEVEMDLYKDMSNNRLAFNPYLLNRITTNPFKLEERVYPVDMGTASEKKIILTIHLPEGYSIETPPKNTGLVLPNNGGSFKTVYEANENGAYTFSHIIQMNRPVYSSEEYPYLKEFYNKIIQAEQADIIFKKN
ncbi:transglutaminase domain-containing protein [Mucilaginibacter terrae]|uniref:Transglutaminase-like domain-containing protein n=1 Tax=Mucilaginibacter terrae TaxID=1955052 RepID=A0ABU3GS40_9SPHI|nr:DUF3857 domain-containing protein [Mucilaginibacter terrae]MDT3402386.1 hypothetical protein [Mucilaginibacter terrae]